MPVYSICLTSDFSNVHYSFACSDDDMAIEFIRWQLSEDLLGFADPSIFSLCCGDRIVCPISHCLPF